MLEISADDREVEDFLSDTGRKAAKRPRSPIKLSLTEYQTKMARLTRHGNEAAMTSQTSTGIARQPQPVVVATGLTAAAAGAPLEPEMALPVKSSAVLQLEQLLSEQKRRARALHSWIDSKHPPPLPES